MAENELNLSNEEKAILETYEADEWQSVEDRKTKMPKYQQYASATYKKD